MDKIFLQLTHEEIASKIFEIIEMVKTNNIVKFDLMREHSLSRSYPGGEQKYFKEKMFELKKQIADKSVIGQTWVENNCRYDIFENSWIVEYSKIAIEHMNERAVFEDIQWFIERYFQLMDFEEIVKKSNNLQTETIPIPELKDNSELKKKALDILVVLSGNWINGKKIMTDEEFTRVVQAVYHLIDSDEVKPIDNKNRIKTSATMIFIRRLFWEINNELYKGKSVKKDSFIKLLHTYFERFSGSVEKTTFNNFKEYRNGNFEVDYKIVLDSIKK